MIFDLKTILLRLIQSLPSKEAHILDRMIHYRILGSNNSYSEHLHHYYWENQVDFWDENPSPVRPSKGDIAIYRGFIEQVSSKQRILILGSTPELRDMAAQIPDAKVYIADFSYRMPLAMFSFTKHVDVLREKWIKDNWLELPFASGFFDVILGDLALQQFPPDLEQVFLEKMRFFLKKGGAFVGRFHFLDASMRQETLLELVRKTMNAGIPDRQKFILLKLRVLWFFAEPSRRQLLRSVSAEKFKEFVEHESRSAPLLKHVRDALITDKDSYRSWSPPEKEELERLLLRSFTIVKKAISDDYEDAKYYPIFDLSPKM